MTGPATPAQLRAAAAIVEVQAQQARPHLMGLVNRLLALAADLTPEPTEHDDQECPNGQPL